MDAISRELSAFAKRLPRRPKGRAARRKAD
jgi:hypothetical protein